MPGEPRVDRLGAVLFDMDGTLVDSEKLWDVALVDTLASLGGGPLSEAARVETVGGNTVHSLRVLFREAGVDPTVDALAAAAEFLQGRAAELFATGLPWRPGAVELLGEVHAAGLPAALVTNTERRLADSALATIGAHWFDVTVCGDEVAHGKPAPDVYLRAAELLRVPIEDCLAVEDSPTGAAAAEAAGAVVLVVPCEVPVPPGPARVHRDSLTGLGVSGLADLFAAARAPRVA